MKQAINVTFFNVGREKQSWSSQITTLSHAALYRAVKRSGKLMSRDIDFEVDEETKTGQVIVGGFRIVGEFTYESI